ncbi:hypothetical protein ALO54_102155 [Pseudomonas syringae pv. philadelphi]|uniref:Uncharacterized protein n=1 Tax=Pseudomonas syringae pv. antirrhini TaxID=251702 RepID=A0A0P9NKB9_9PSED|nr:Unknown protein sequence [Pseudomonas syringae pv. maculicola]KPW44041.1 hypothetical protein ALO88_102392 [Pseudomonas syringae pv. antirrhini]KPW45256.1 hypothetical protein ALO86_101921 [Pseudomonas syringae pv. berberidis]KPY14032.1 hypothetical protein ALO54_102155 [Pseudomonas syringae pv. philadelphi]
MSKLDETRADREVTTQANDKYDQYLTGEKVVNHFQHFCYSSLLLRGRTIPVQSFYVCSRFLVRLILHSRR